MSTTSVCKRLREFHAGDIYRIHYDDGITQKFDTVRVVSVTNLFVQFESVMDERKKYSGMLSRITEPFAQSCNIDGWDMIYSYDKQDWDAYI